MSQWISVKERLPEQGAMVLVASHGDDPAARWLSLCLCLHGWFWVDDAVVVNVTHWMPAPELP